MNYYTQISAFLLTEDLSLKQASILETLYQCGSIPMGDISAYTGINPPCVTQAFRVLEKMGLAGRSRVSRDNRVVLGELTPAGRLAVERLVEFAHSAFGQLAHGAGPVVVGDGGAAAPAAASAA